jgi:DUF4097 and DUF4098 domain-containing protein YvlB
MEGSAAPGAEPSQAEAAPSAAAPNEAAADLPTGPVIEIGLVAGDFSISGGAPGVRLNVPGGYGAEDAEGATQSVIHFSDLPHRSELHVPDGARVRVRRVTGDLRADHLDAMLVVASVGGDAELDRVAVADLQVVDGDLTAERGGSLRAGSVSGDVRIEDFDDACLFESISGDLHAVLVPRLAVSRRIGGDATVEHCHEVTLAGMIGGDLRVEHGEARVRAQSVGGELRLTNLESASAARVGGDLKAEQLGGGVEVNLVGGDARIRVARGSVHLGTVGGDLTLQGTPSGVLAARVGGDATLDTPLGEGAEFSVRAAGDISLRVRGEVNARFVAQSAGGEVRTRLPLVVEKGRRRNLVGMLGTGSATVTLRSDGGDIFITAAESTEGSIGMSDEFEQHGPEEEHQTTGTATGGPRTWEGTFGGHRFRVRWDRRPDHAAFHFQGPVPEGEEDPDGVGGPYNRAFGVEWDRGQGARTYGEYEERLRDFGEKAERVARRAAEQAQRYAERAAQRARETDWEAVGREVRTAIERAMRDLEDAFNNMRGEWETRRPGGSGAGSSTGGSRPAAQRVRIEHDDEDTEGTSGTASYGATQAGPASEADASGDRDAQRRIILEQLRTGALSIEEAERRLNALK